MTVEVTVRGVRYEVHLVYERVPGDGGPGWCIEDVQPEPPDCATHAEVCDLAYRDADTVGY
jgi:hypothetical protein